MPLGKRASMSPRASQKALEATARLSLGAMPLDTLQRLWERRGGSTREFVGGDIEVLGPACEPLMRAQPPQVVEWLRERLGEPPLVRMPPLPGDPPGIDPEATPAKKITAPTFQPQHPHEPFTAAAKADLQAEQAKGTRGYDIRVQRAAQSAMLDREAIDLAARCFVALVLLADDTGKRVLDEAQCSAALDVLEAAGLIEWSGDEMRVLDIERYDRSNPRAICERAKRRLMD